MVIIMISKRTPEQKEKVDVNTELATNKIQNLLKCAQSHLNKSKTLENNSITDEYMIVFALDYMSIMDGYDVKYTEEYMVANISEIQQVVEYIFGRQANYSNTEFELVGDNLYVPIYPIGTDLDVYKLKSKEYNELENTYTVYIDCLGISPSQYYEITDSNTIDYSQEDVIKTMIFKYKELDGRKVLLSYNAIWNI